MTLSIFQGDAILHRAAPERVNRSKANRTSSLYLIEQDFWMSILLDVGIGLEINVLTSKFILLGDQMLGEMGCHPEICF